MQFKYLNKIIRSKRVLNCTASIIGTYTLQITVQLNTTNSLDVRERFEYR